MNDIDTTRIASGAINPAHIDPKLLPEPDGSETVEELVTTWHQLSELAALISTHARLYSVAAAAAMDIEGHTQYDTAEGVTVHVAARSNDAWDGRLLLSRLSVDVVDTATGERTPAVPLEVLADIIPAVDGKSSKWLTKGLVAHGIDPDDYRTRTWSTPTLAKGTKR